MQDTDVAYTPPISSPEFWKRPERVAASTDPDTATAQTIRIMCDHVKRAAQDERFRVVAHESVDMFGPMTAGLGLMTESEELARSAFWWCKHFIRFVHHEFIIRQRLGEAGHLQGLISPDVLVQMDSPEGDCAIFTECVCAFLRVLGVPYEMVTVAVNPQEPSVYSHVYLYAVMPDGSRLPIDASHGLYPGWQVPSSDVFRRQVWDENGRPVEDRGSRFDGLHNYALRGMGVAPLDPSLDVSEGGSYVPPPPATSYDSPGFDIFTSNDPGWFAGGSSSSGGGASPWGGFIANLANQWTKIGGQVIAPTVTYQRDAQGNLIYSAPAGSAAASSLPSSLGGSSSLFLLGGLAVGAVLLFSAMGKGK